RLQDVAMSDLNTSFADGIFTLEMNRAKTHNAFDEALITAMTDALRSAEADAGVRAVVLRAAGKSFSAGGDLDWMRRMAAYSPEENLADARQFAELMRVLAELAKPTIALVQGDAYGGGVGLVAACDIAIASEAAGFALSEVKLGLIPAV